MSHSFPGSDDIVRAELSNGVVVLSRANFNSPAVVINGYLAVGSLLDPQEHLGLASFTASALLRGSARHSFQEIYDILESVGASLHFEGGTHSTIFAGQMLTEDFALLLDLLADGLRNPVFPPTEIERLRSQILAGLAIRDQDTAAMAELAFDGIIYADHPYSRPDEGFTETVQSIRPEDITAFHQRAYGPAGLVIVVVGAIDPNQAVDQISRVLGDWDNPGQTILPVLPNVKPLSEQTIHRVRIPGKAQADLILGAAGPTRRAVDYMAANIGNNILGQFGMMGRIGEAVREQAGLAYYSASSLGGGLGPGPWDVSAAVDPQAVEHAIELILGEIRRFVSEPVSDDELADTQAQFMGSLPLSLESNYGVAGALLSLERYQLGLDYFRNYAKLIQSVTKEDVLLAAQHYLDPDRLGIGIAGP